MMNGIAMGILLMVSPNQYSGSFNTFRIGIKHMKLPLMDAIRGPLKMER